MRKLLGAGLGLALLFGCAATPQVAQKEEPQVQATECVSAAALKKEMEANKVMVVADLEGEPFDDLVAWITPLSTRKPPPAGADRAVIFLNPEKTLAMVTWFKGDCFLAYNMGPWQPLSDFLGVAI